jgi:glycosyltransferase involved in cell wall biosynthesis
VHFLGSKPPASLPAYINAFDVCINPQIVNAVTIGNYPRKIDEYLAAGKPTVATKTEAMSIFSEYVYLAETKDDYVMLIKKALANNSDEMSRERQAFATSHTWANSVKEIYKAINTLR